MIKKEIYEKIKERYGYLSSWAVWKLPDSTPKSNTGDLTVFAEPEVLSVLNTNYVFVGLNVSNTHGNESVRDNNYWANFHSNYKYQNDYKLRYALMNTPFWGSYMTDIIKKYPEVDSNKVKAFLNQNPNVVKQNIEEFKLEMSILNSNEKPVLIAMGDMAYQILKKYLSDEFKIVKIMHYSNMIGEKEYRKSVLEGLNEI